jgi:hypothetical protein
LPVPHPVPPQGEPLSPAANLSNNALLQAVLAAGVIVIFTFLFGHSTFLIRRAYGRFTNDVFYMRDIFRFLLALAASVATAWLLQPSLATALHRWRSRTSQATQRVWAGAALAVCCVLLAAFVIYFGRKQFGGFDYNIITEVGWRQILGQRPYLDFLTTSPPLFNLGILLAFRLFGVTWDGMLLFTAFFTIVTFLWLYALLRQLGMTAFAALGTASTLEVATMLSCCFWWYNNSTLLLAAIFFLSALLLTRPEPFRFAQVSYVVSLALLSLAKPNIAGVTIAGSVVLLLIATRRPLRVILLTLAGTVLSLLIFKAAHISIPAMLATYHGAAKERGAFSKFGYDEYTWGWKHVIQLWYLALCLPLLAVIKPLWLSLRQRDLRAAARWLFFPFTALIAIYGLRGNGELYDMETTALVASLGLLAFALPAEGPLLRRFTVALFCGMAASNLYTGIARDRVYTIGPHMFFEWQDADHTIASGPLKHMQVSSTFAEVETQIKDALANNPGPYFFGPRVDYSYMAENVPSPRHFPAWWHPGTAFDRALMPTIVANWDQQRFPTLIFLKGDYTFYPPSLLNDLKTEYIRDDRYPRLTVYRRRPGL